MKIRLFVAREIRYFELGIFSFNSYVYYLTHGFIASTRAFNLPTRAFSLPTRAFNPATRAFSVLTRGFELVTLGFELVTRNSCFSFPQNFLILIRSCECRDINLFKIKCSGMIAHILFPSFQLHLRYTAGGNYLERLLKFQRSSLSNENYFECF